MGWCKGDDHKDVRGGVCRACGALVSEPAPDPCATCGGAPTSCITAASSSDVIRWSFECQPCGYVLTSPVSLGLGAAVQLWNARQTLTREQN